ncbi:glycoside hydrolase family 2 TIM barrel-domain containing protein [Draconibacterium halophilum]|uniref:Glycoside hydrolase family 2 protein n=1 Tax=Draconibacterium halophilum TaxID=2706887 RepID=A0A6C0RGM7_9BACT|nr:glycoside hydrolase family 2 TIM barrel-domain containing protein [Draconibacterium halophilum]QIA09146.1 glycoside hydrolase family 2 protein [Draconibacterium halophilum]
MKTRLIIFVLAMLTSCQFQTEKQEYFADRSQPFDQGWLFAKDSVGNAQQPVYDDSKWQEIELPHDWSINDLPNQNDEHIIGPFNKRSLGFTQTGFTMGGTGWYRKTFKTGDGLNNKQVTINFDGVYMNSDVWLNGYHLGNHPHGYTPFHYDLTPYLNPVGQENVLAVRVKNEGRNSRWYSGSGIYRHVWLTITENIHVVPWGIYITTSEVSDKKATVNIQTTVESKQPLLTNMILVTTILSSKGQVVGESKQELALDINEAKIVEQNIKVTTPLLWSVETPHLYNAVTEIKKGDTVLDKINTQFGIRTIQVDAKNGLRINGNNILLRGGCIHHDNGLLGAAAIDRAEERKIELLKANGFNAIRSSHNPPSSHLLNACDRIGMLVIDEAFDMWEEPKIPDDYHLNFRDRWQRDLQAMVLRDRNHPSVIMWSIGNEIRERVDTSGLRITKQLAKEVRRLDPTRPVTAALCEYWEPANKDKKWSETEPAFELLDVAGYNYLWQLYEQDHQQFPDRIILGTETLPNEALENWNMAENHPYVIGDFVWTAMDYLGEASVGRAYYDKKERNRPTMGWPWYNAWCGDIDLIGQKKPQSYYRDVVWRNRPIAMAVHEPIPDGMVENISRWGWPQEWQSWTWSGSEGKSLQVRVFSRAPMVRLLLNGRTIGEQAIADTSITAVFDVPYQPGTLKAVNVENGKETAVIELKTAGIPHGLRLIADRTNINADRNDLSYITVEIVDENNQLVPNFEIPVQFSIEGVGEIAAVGNADPTDMASFHTMERKTFNGRCLAIVRPKGNAGVIKLTATSEGLIMAQILIKCH